MPQYDSTSPSHLAQCYTQATKNDMTSHMTSQYLLEQLQEENRRRTLSLDISSPMSSSTDDEFSSEERRIKDSNHGNQHHNHYHSLASPSGKDNLHSDHQPSHPDPRFSSWAMSWPQLLECRNRARSTSPTNTSSSSSLKPTPFSPARSLSNTLANTSMGSSDSCSSDYPESPSSSSTSSNPRVTPDSCRDDVFYFQPRPSQTDRGSPSDSGRSLSDLEEPRPSQWAVPSGLSGRSLVCRWKHCGMTFQHQQDLAQHVNEDHVRVERPDLDFQCQWAGCPRQGKGFNARYLHSQPRKCCLFVH